MPAHALPFFASSVPDRGHVRDQVRFFVPGSCVSNLDFVESIFGNGDNPDLAENDAALDPGPPPFFLSSPFRAPSSVHQQHWTGVTGAVILAPHLLGLNAKEMGLPHKKDATERQIKDGMFWEKEDDKYNRE
eukprot:2040256-Rhodomonas_salina.2